MKVAIRKVVLQVGTSLSSGAWQRLGTTRNVRLPKEVGEMASNTLSMAKENEMKDPLNYDLMLALVVFVAMGVLAFLGGYFSNTLVKIAAA